ncbi:hypothetical protein [Saccharococcus sp. Marseille-Q5394]|uniref:hypothetical protein n=1 Tax=Saccharococcus sp. Marseille-Q5394 TaxID=2972778 RepID=UPI0021C6319A|nr:hypothetical protein [Saccharococcus sp. Marseille-Q5394]
MGHTPTFVLGLVGSIMAILGCMLWIWQGTFFWAGFIEGIKQIEGEELLDESIRIGFIIAGIQTLLTLPFYIVTLVKSCSSKSLRSVGLWLLIVGIATLLINVFHIIPCILLIIAGILALIKEKGSKDDEEVTSFRVEKSDHIA